MELTLEDLMVALQPKGLPDPILYQYYKIKQSENQLVTSRLFVFFLTYLFFLR